MSTTSLHHNGWPASEISADTGKPTEYVGVGSAFALNGRKFVIVTKTADDLLSVLEDIGWSGRVEPNRFCPTKVSKP
jgi:hypothetical protein